MRWPVPRSVPWTIAILGCSLFAGTKILVASPATDGGVAEFIRTHPTYRGYIISRSQYPLAARMNHAQGDLELQVTFAKTGEVSKVRLVKLSGSPLLDGNAIYYARKYWRSTMGERRTITVPFSYRLR